MWFLLLQIVFLMLLAAACGAGLAWWWFRRNYEDVTTYHEELVAKATGKEVPATPPLTREELNAGLSGLKLPDVAPLQERLVRIENALALTGTTGLGALNERFSRIEKTLSVSGEGEDTAFAVLGNRLGRMETLLQQPDDSLEAVLSRLSDLESSVLSVSNEVTRLQNADLDPIEARLGQIEDAVRSQTVPEPDLGPVHAGLARLELAIENMDMPTADIEPLRVHLAAMESRLAEFAERLDTARKSDLEELTIRMSTLSSSLAGLKVPDIDTVKQRLAKIEESIASIEIPDIQIPEQDLTPLANQLREIESLLRAPSDDMRAMHTKLADIEGGSASLHSKLSGVEHMVGMLARSGVDLTPVQSRLSAMETVLASLRAELQSLPDFAPLERRLSNLQDAVMSMREPDLSPVLSSMRKLDARLDMGTVDSRLASIEYTLAALNHMLRARDFSGYGRGEGEYTYRQPVYAPPRTEPPSFAPIDKVIPEPAGVRMPKAPPPPPPPPPPPSPSPEAVVPSDPLEAARRPGDKANLLVEAAFGEEDDLEVINGIGPMLCELLNDIGVYYFWQIADWGPAEIEWVDQKLEHFKGRIERDDWVGQARVLAKSPTAAPRPGTE